MAFAACLVLGACNTATGECPAKETIVPGASCTETDLQCAFDLATPSPACDGTSTTIPTSCTCTSSAWACPSPVQCSTDGGSDASADAAGSDAMADAPPPDAGVDAPPEAAPKDSGKDTAAADARHDGPG
jgi:hypothetical protein